MDENQNENIDSQNGEEQNTNEQQLTVDDYNKLLAEKQALEEANKKLYARVKKSSDTKPLAETQGNSSELTTEITKLKLKVDHGITDPEAIDFVMKNGGEEALKNPYIKSAVDGMTAQKRAEQAVVDGDTGKSDVERKYSTEQLKSMSSEELEKILPHA